MLRTKSLFIVTVSSLIVFILIFVNLKKSIEKDYEHIEIGISKSVYKLINNEFNSSYSNLEKLNLDWSKWDDTYEFVDSEDPEIREHYINSNLVDTLLEDLDLDLVIFLNDRGKIVYQTSYDEDSNRNLSLEEISALKDELQFHNEKTGMIDRKNNKILVFSNLEITDSNNSKKPVGNLIMGYFLDENKLKTLEEKLGIPFNILGVSEDSKNPYEIKIEKDTVLNKFYIPTLSGRSLVLENQRDANILFLGKENIKKYIVMLLINFLILIFVIYIFMERFIVKRLRNMEHSVKEIIKHKDLGKRLEISGKDEIGNLGKNINNLLEDIERMKKRLYSLATYDVMTGILNRHIGLEKLDEKFKNVKKNKASLVIVFIDINDLKYVNDQFSHEEGDKLIKNVVKTIEDSLQPEDIFLRFGGDEFILGFDRLNILEAGELFNEIQEKFEEYSKNNVKKYKISISIGMVECYGDDTLEEYINLADIQMYEDKKKKKKLPERIYI
ncbi:MULTISPECIES: sensor domain-containing diguanylate cyclase [Psychrilyobacter]|uniref:Diguanylate cyclase n=1 Tax=Psychrilyobacter piezotolerans TaxID=2293438 RepID=A0ABX9KGT3_9FUSO|nr:MULTISPECIES: diguanylate cyclase [Psychrilyobacter]MCS5420709.1 diguanylate cyclase [Psychrilyobacter sp. S5]NDI78015.1 diguanylate cyclase [Psychrilyobacter piezotolerans]RDE61955.1 diguanylate cyclase [Psychrilyobacter sp. S5]REI41181.1 diguanylate cyclase [Psychrilyobacter piezotolerans]